MSEQELEELDLDDGSVDDEIVEEAGDDDTHEDTSKKNKSNFKNLYKKAKEAETRAEKAEREAEELKEKLQAWESENPDVVKSKYSNDELGTIKEQIFLVANPDAKAHLDKVKARVKQYGMPMEEAWEDIRLRLPKESISTEDFNIKGKPKSDRIDYTKVKLEDTSEFTSEQRKAWRKANNWG